MIRMGIAFLPFAAAVLSAAFRTGHGQRRSARRGRFLARDGAHPSALALQLAGS
jgi:hypothetical protein